MKLNEIILGDCRDYLAGLPEQSIHLFLSDIPYGIHLSEWDVFHENTNSAFLGASPAQEGKSAFKRRGKPIRGWNKADRAIGEGYEDWVYSWSRLVYPVMKKGAPLLVFGARRTLHRVINAFERSGFILKDVLAWKKKAAVYRAQRVSIVLERRGLMEAAEEWQGWRLGNPAPIYEPIAWFFKPYRATVTDNILEHGVGAFNGEMLKSNLIDVGYASIQDRIHEAQKPVEVIEVLIELVTVPGQVILDPFMGSGTTAIAARNLQRDFLGYEIDEGYHAAAVERIRGG